MYALVIQPDHADLTYYVTVFLSPKFQLLYPNSKSRLNFFIMARMHTLPAILHRRFTVFFNGSSFNPSNIPCDAVLSSIGIDAHAYLHYL